MRGKTRTFKASFWLGLALVFALQSVTVIAQETLISREDFTVALGPSNFPAKAQLTYPADQQGPFPLIVLIHGSAPADMDYHRYNEAGVLLSHDFKDLADYLSSHGFAVVRYNKRCVYSKTEIDSDCFRELSLQDLLMDAETVLEAAKNKPAVNPNNVFVYGRSEGSIIGAHVALRDPSLRGLLLQGTVAHSVAKLCASRLERVGVPYLSDFATQEKLGPRELIEAATGHGGEIARNAAASLLGRTARGDYVVRAIADINDDGRIDLEFEANRFWGEVWCRDEPAVLGKHASVNALPTLLQIAPQLQLPVLILQGENDAFTPAEGAKDFYQALMAHGHSEVTIRLYSGLGHSLGPASSIIEDDHAPIDVARLGDLVTWLKRHTD